MAAPNHLQKLTDKQIFRLVDANGRQRAIGAVACDCCKRGLVVGLASLPIGMHMSNSEALFLIEALRAGPAFQMLKPSPAGMGRRYCTQVVNDGKWLLGYDEAGVCDFLCCGGPPYLLQGSAAVALLPEQRAELGDRLFAELMEHATDVARA